ncbi:MAG: HepT-like ribonuclease domain-containing protein [Candidatus Binatia bacterium]
MWRDDAWLLDMLQSARKALDYASGLSEDQFMADSLRQDAILRQLTILGEASKKISNDLRAAHPEISWRKIAGFRDVVVHDYFGVNLNEVWRIIQDDLPALANLLEPLVPPEESNP